VLLLVGALLLFLSGYAVYALFLGGIDGLTQLPPEWLPPDGEAVVPPALPLPLRELMIQQAFGKDCDELRRQIKLLVRDKGLVLAAGEFFIEQDGRVKLAPFSAAMFPKSKDGGKPEIYTVQCDFAFLTLDKPVQYPSELANRKVTAVELRGSQGVTLINNRRTEDFKGDDLEIHITMSPLFYEERRNLVWTDGWVKLQDFQSQPKPTLITAKGMELHLSPDASPNKPRATRAAAKAKGQNTSNIDLLILRSNVNMHFYVDASDGFLGNSDDRPARKAPGPKAMPEKSHVFIRTLGPFTYDPNKELAWFDSPPAGAGGLLAAQPEQVFVSREHPEKKFDQLVCDRLALHFRKKSASAKAAPQDPAHGSDKEIESAVATVRPGQKVTLTMDTENLEAYGSELHYHCADPGHGPQTMLKGAPMRAIKDGNKIKAQELHLTANDRDGKGQRVYAKGPGRIDVTDTANPKKEFPIHVLWNDTLVSTQEWDGQKFYDLWTITQDAAYVDDEQKQELRGQKIQLWMVPNDAARGGPRASGGPKNKIHKVEAFERVFAMSPEAIIKRTDHLLIVFRPEIIPGGELPELPEPVAASQRAVSNGPVAPGLRLPRWTEPETLVRAAQSAPAIASSQLVPGRTLEIRPAPPNSSSAPPGPSAASPVIGASPEKPPPRKPIQLEAKDVVIYVATVGTKKQLDKVDASNNVHVQQEAEKADEKGLDITGDLLTLTRDPKGDSILTVFGDARKLARFEMGETILLGPKVTVDQISNVAHVEGQGAMEMPSKTSIDGERPAKPGTRMTIHWNKDMTFDGKNAHFTGGVQGYQDHSLVKSETMQAVMDRMVVFREGQKLNQGAKVERLLCNKNVYILDEVLDKDQKRMQASILECRDLSVNNIDGPTHAYGPGRLRHLALGDKDAESTGGAPKPAPKDKEMKLTQIEFRGWMFSNTKANYKNATFLEGVEVYNVPSEVFEVKLSPERLPKEGFYLKCEKLKLLARQEEQKTVQAMVAETQVFFRTQECWGYADTVSFDEASDNIILDAAPGNLVRFYKRTRTENKDVTGERILYNRKTGNVRVEKNGSINSSWLDRSIPLARLHAHGQDQPVLALRLAAGHDRQELAAHGAVNDLALVRRDDCQADLVVLVRAVLDDHIGGLVVDEREGLFLTGLQ
jgi:hypothetical protein